MHLLSGSRRLKKTSKWHKSDVQQRRSWQNVTFHALLQTRVSVHVVSSLLAPFHTGDIFQTALLPIIHIMSSSYFIIINLMEWQHTTVPFQCGDAYLKMVLHQQVWTSLVRNHTTYSFLSLTLHIHFCHFTQCCHVCSLLFLLLYSVDIFVSSLERKKKSYLKKKNKQII